MLLRCFLVALELLAVLAVRSAAQATSPAADASGQPTASERAFVASKIYAQTQIYFAHWQAVPDFDLDSAYKRYLNAAVTAKGRLGFDLATEEFVATLHNGHTGFYDHWLQQNYGARMGFRTRVFGNAWVITQSDRAILKPGQIITAINGTLCEEYYQQHNKYLAASSDRNARSGFFPHRELFPLRVRLTLADGQAAEIDRTQPLAAPTDLKTKGCWLTPGQVAYIKVPGFDDPKFEKDALALVTQYRTANTLIVDVRGNGGGSTPADLVDALMDRRYRFWAEATPVSVGLFKERTTELDTMQKAKPPAPLPDETRGYLEAFGQVSSNAQWYLPAAYNAPGHPIFSGRLLLLTDRGCFSATEDFLVPFKDNGRAVLVGETTGGSSGQPASYDFGNGMSFRVSTKREYMPDGSPFEGIGIRPDIEVTQTAADIAAGRDSVLAKAVEIANAH